MTIEEFRASLQEKNPPAAVNDELLQALWYAAKGDWHKAHQIVQGVSGEEAAWVHAYLHREEGDEGNASYWYRRANRPKSSLSLYEEWDEIVQALWSR